MKQILLFVILFILNCNSFSAVTRPVKNENPALWLITAKVTSSSMLQHDTVMKFDMGGHMSIKESHTTARTIAQVQVTAVVENQAENPETEFMFISDSGEPVNITVSGSGMHSEDSKYKETIDGKLISEDDRNINVSGSPFPGASIQFGYSSDSKYAEISATINAKGTDKGRMFYNEWKDYGGNVKDYSISCSSGCDQSSDKGCTVTKTSKGYQASWSFSESKQVHSAGGTDFITEKSTLEVTVTPYKEPDKPEVTLLGCTDLATGEQSNVIATGKPEGGKFRFWVEPGDLFKVESDGESSANLTGATPGKGTLYVEYTTPEGKTNQKSQAASCVKVENYNNGQEIPQIALYDIDGKKQSGIKSIPVQAQPSNAEELVDFVPADPSVISAVGRSGAVELTGLHEGKTTLQAKTNCGEKTGPAVEVEVVNCDDETIATLERMMKAAQEGQKQAYEAIEKIVGTKEFEEMESKIAESTGNLAVKTAGLIIGTLAGGTTAGAGVETAAGIYGKASNVMDILKGGDALSQISNVSQLIVELGGKAMQQAIAGSIETLQAANEFGQDLGKMIGANRELQSAMKEAEHWNKIIIDLVGRQKLCRRGSQEPQGKQEPKSEPGMKTPEPKPTPTERTTKTQTPPTQQPSTSEPTQTTEPATADEPSGDGTEISPPPPTSEPRKVGLPYSPAECGCNKTNTLEVSQKGFSSLQTGMENLEKCVDTFSKGPLTNYIQTLQDWQTVLNKLSEATKTKPAEFKLVSEQSLPKMESLLQQTKTFDTEGKTFVDAFGSCPKSMEAGVGLMQSAEKITVDSIKTKY